VTPRIVSLLPSATEIVSALGFADALVGRSHECDFPPGVEELPVCTSPKVGGADTREIHASVGAVLQHESSVYDIDAALLRELDPTVVVTQMQCEVCAVSLRDVEAALADWRGPTPRLVALNPQSLDDVFDDIRRVAGALDADDRGVRLVETMQTRMRAIARPPSHPRVATIEWMEPLMAAGNWMPSLVELAGGIDVLAHPGEHSSWMTWDALGEADPDVLVVMPCGFGIDAIQRDWQLLAGHPMWQTLRAVRAGRVYLADGNQYFNRPGPRLAESVEILAEIFHGLPLGYEGKAFVRCTS
jgi:iron complex transport system substrate-binding protein